MPEQISVAKTGPDLRPVTLITGASAGIGRALALEFASHGHDLLLIARGAEPLEEVASKIERFHGVHVYRVVLDVATPDAADHIVAFACANLLAVEILVNNAAGWVAGPFADCQPDAATGLMALNIAAPLALARALLPGMIARGGGAILNVGSLAGEVPSPGVALYSASKSFMRSITLALRHELAGKGIVVSLLVPGLVDTEFTQPQHGAPKSLLRSVLAASPEVIAKAGYRGVMADRAIIVPGLLSRLTYFGLRFLPRPLAIRLRTVFSPHTDDGVTSSEEDSSGSATGQSNTARKSVVSSLSGARRVLRQLGRHRLVTLILLLGAMAAISGLATIRKASHQPPSVDPGSSIIAADLLAAFRSDGDIANRIVTTPKPGRSLHTNRAPGYGLVLFGVALFDRGVAGVIECQANKRHCNEKDTIYTIAVIQLLVAMLGLVCIFAAALRLSASWEVALLTLILAYLASRIGDLAGVMWSGVWPPALTYLALYLMIEAHLRRNALIALGSGLAIGAGALFMPQMIVMAPAAALFMLGAAWGKRRRLAGAVSAIALVVGAGAAGLLLVFSHSHTYELAAMARQVTADLSVRAAYQAIGLEAWIAGLIMPIPIIGGLAPLVFSPEAINLVFERHQSGTLAWLGTTEIFPRAIASTTSMWGQYFWVVNSYISGNILSYLAVTPAIIMRGLFAGAGKIGLFGLFHIKTLIAYHRVDKRMALLGIVFGPVALLFAVNVFISGNSFLNNPGLTFLYAYAIAYIAGSF